MQQTKKPLKNTTLIVVLVALIATPGLLAQDDDCKVKPESLQGTYEGECRRGLAHGYGKASGTDTYEGEFRRGYPDGQGTYTWSNGNIFKGTFSKGKKEGEGKLIYNPEVHPDSVRTGFWEDDTYYGSYKDPYKVLEKTNPVNRIIVRKLGESPHDIMIKGDMDYLREKGLNSRFFTGQGFDNIQFPFTLDMEASHANVPFSFKVIIFEPGRWEVVVNFN